MDRWELAASIAGLAFNVGFLAQIKETLSTKRVEGLSAVQWLIFTLASVTFVAFYIHLGLWIMTAVSVIGTVGAAIELCLILRYRKK